MKLEELKAKHPKLWKKAQEKYDIPEVQVKYFRGLVSMEQAKEKARITKSKKKKQDQRRRAKAMTLFTTRIIEYCVKNGHVQFVRDFISTPPMTYKEGRYEVDCSKYILEELEATIEKAAKAKKESILCPFPKDQFQCATKTGRRPDQHRVVVV